MERGLLWLPLLGLFIGLAWAGWNEYQKLEAYKAWATQFERAKYDIYAALGQTSDRLVWGRPTRQGPTSLQSASLLETTEIQLHTPETPPPADAGLPRGCQICLAVQSTTGDRQWIPFTDADLAAAWRKQLQTLQESLQSTPQSST